MMRVLLSIFSFLFLLFLLIATLLLTPAGLVTTASIATQLLPGQWHYKKISGSLLGPMTITELDYQSSHIHVTAAQLKLRWSLRSLWHKTIHIYSMSGQDIDIDLTQNASSHASLPFTLQIDQGDFKNITFTHAGTPYIADLHLKNFLLNHDLQGSIQLVLRSPYPALMNINLAGFDAATSIPIFSVDATVHTHDLIATVKGSNKKQWDLNWKINSAGGSLQSQGRIQGAINHPVISLTHFSMNSKTLGHWQLPHSTTLSIPTNQKTSIKFTLNQKNLAALRQWIPAELQIKGTLVGDFHFAGTWSAPILMGNIRLTAGHIAIPALQITLDRMTVKLTATREQANYDMLIYSQNQPIHVVGNTLFSTGMPTQLKITGNHILLINTAEYEIYGSPDLQVHIQQHQVSVQGTLRIPKAYLAPVDLSGAITLPTDVVFVGPGAAKVSPWQLTMKITLIVGDDVQINAHGAEGQLAGQVTLVQTPQQPLIATGRISVVHGIFQTKLNLLTVEPNSSISYQQSPLNNPQLNIRTARQIPINHTEDTVGLAISGTLRQPSASLYSSPLNLSQADILSYLIFGQPANANTPDNVNYIVETIDQLRFGHSAYATNNNDLIKQQLGISEYGIQTQSALNAIGTPLGQEDSAYVLGRYISPRIYLRYSRGLVIPINIVQVRYLLGRNWAIQSESSSLGNGGDVLYTIQRP